MRIQNSINFILISFCALLSLASCNRNNEPENSKLLIGSWVWVDEMLTDASIVVSFDGNGGAKMSRSQFVGYEAGYKWSTLDLSYFIEGDHIEMDGNYYQEGVKLHIEGEVIKLNDQEFEVRISSFIISNSEIGPYEPITFKRANEGISHIAGTWKVTYPSLGLINYYVINENNNNLCYEKDEDGVWQVYEYEKFHCYGDLLIWEWQDTNDPDDYRTVEGYIVDNHGDKLFMVRYNVNQPLSEIVFFERVEASEIPKK